MKKAWVAVVLLCGVLISAGAVVIRHDRDDAKYLALGAKYPQVGVIGRAGDATLIAPQWALTAAHVARGARAGAVTFAGVEYPIAERILHPQWRDGGPHDVGLLRLAQPVTGITPMALYEKSDEAGKVAILVGHGGTGTGEIGPRGEDGKKRACTNRVESADENWITFRFDEPPSATDLEGIPGPGDSGGPSILEVNGVPYVAGVSVWGQPGKNGRGTYGAMDGSTRVSTHLKWLRSAMAGGALASPAALAQSAAASALPDTPAGKAFAEFLELFNAGDKEKMKQYVARSHSKRLLERNSPEKLADMHLDMRQETGGLEFMSVVRSSATELVARVRAKSDGEMLDFTISVEAQPPFGLTGFQVTPAGEAPVQAPAAVEIPDTPAGRRMKAWLPVIARGDSAEIAKFVRENFAQRALAQMPAEERAKVHTDFFAETGGLKAHSVRKSEPAEIEILAQAAKTGQWFRVGLRVEPEAPGGIMGFLFDEAQPPAASPASAAPGPRKKDGEIAEEVGKLVDDLARDSRFSGTVLLAKDGKPFLEKAVGKASLRYDVPVRIDTRFNLGSMNKMFTAVAIAQLVEQGKLSFNDTVGKILPDYPNPAVREKVTLHHLLTHSSGLGSYFASKKYEDTWTKLFTVDDFLKTFAEEPPAFEPGQRFLYSNSGFIVLGKIVEKISGISYYDYVREHIYQPAGMNDSDSYEMDKEVPNLATGYTLINPLTDRPDGILRNNYYQHSIKGGPAGGGYSTVQDLLRFDQALRSGKLLSPKYVEMLVTGKISMGGPNMQYGYGFGVETLPSGRRIIGHNGGAPGINGWLDSYWEDGYTVAVLCNLDRCAQPVVQRAKQLLTAP